MIQSKVFVDPEDASECANFRDPAMDRREHNEVGIFVLMKLSKSLIS